MATIADAQKWFLQWSTITWNLPTQDGRPWGDGTEFVTQRVTKRVAASQNVLDPWDQGCGVTPLIGGYETMCAMRNTFEDAISAAKNSSQPAGQRGHVYIAGWRLNPLRDLSDGNVWITSPWAPSQAAKPHDQTLAGFLLRLMQAGINVRILAWMPITAAGPAADLGSHIADEFFLAELARNECTRLGDSTRALVGLDLRVAKPLTAAHHQKMMVIRVGNVNVAYCGGVDLAFTRRDAPIQPNPAHPATSYKYDENSLGDVTAPAPQFLDGDWQSGDAIPQQWTGATAAVKRWPQETVMPYAAIFNCGRPGQFPSDLPDAVYGGANQLWHDQHLRLSGPIVATVEGQFIDRWKDSGDCHDLGAISGSHFTDNQTIFSGPAAYDGNTPIDLEDVTAVPSPAGAGALVQMWRTIPLRDRAKGSRFQRGEFTVMAGLSNAIKNASELIWLFDQYFWSRPTARLLNDLVRQPGATVQVIIVLPPYADVQFLHIHHARKLALNDLISGLVPGTQPGTFEPPSPTGSGGRVAVFNTWRKPKAGEAPGDPGFGIYVHAKTKMFDDKLLVCGSANINQRSHTCDTELDCAVLDEVALDIHQKRLWKVLFPSSPWPATIVRPGPGWGVTFFDEFAQAAAEADSNLIPDPWNTEPAPQVTKKTDQLAEVTVTPPTLPNGVKREQDYRMDFYGAASAVLGPGIWERNIGLTGQSESDTGPTGAATLGYSMPPILNPLALASQVEQVTAPGAKDPGHAGRLDEVVYLIEGVPGRTGAFPYRKAN
jgi:phosphatidylserine/phosphatidylglycerophosphate/cardiolipin synthase-like enzyme